MGEKVAEFYEVTIDGEIERSSDPDDLGCGLERGVEKRLIGLELLPCIKRAASGREREHRQHADDRVAQSRLSSPAGGAGLPVGTGQRPQRRQPGPLRRDLDQVGRRERRDPVPCARDRGLAGVIRRHRPSR
jgi:hypothetical protein